MDCIKIIKRPPGEPPDWVRDAWIGLILPVAGGRPSLVLPERTRGVISGEVASNGGYPVNAGIALEILSHQSVEAAQWWEIKAPGAVNPHRELTFAAEVCELSQGIPGTEPPQEGAMTLQDLIKKLEAVDKPPLLSRPLSQLIQEHCREEEYRFSPLNRLLVLMISYIITLAYRQAAMQTTTEEDFSRHIVLGDKVLRSLHRIATNQGVFVLKEEVNQPIGFSSHASRNNFPMYDPNTKEPTKACEILLRQYEEKPRLSLIW